MDSGQRLQFNFEGSHARNHGIIRPHQSKLDAFYRIIDGFLIIFTSWLTSVLLASEWSIEHALTATLAVWIFLFFAEINNLYRSWRGSHFLQEAPGIFLTWIETATLLFLGWFIFFDINSVNQSVFLAWSIATPILIFVWRGVSLFSLRRLRTQGYNTRSVAIVGANGLASRVANSIVTAPWMGLRITGFYENNVPLDSKPVSSLDLKVNGSVDKLIQLAKEGGVDLIYISWPMREEERIKTLISELSDTTASVYLIPDFFSYDILHSQWTSLNGVPAVSIFESPFYGVDGVVKRIEDVVLSLFILTLIAIPMLFIAIGVKLSSPGPVLYKQRRYGIRGERINVWKFRSMSVCETSEKNIIQAKKCDPRVTRFGAFLRRTSLDELPQFFNVLEGRMSIVGPRPHAIAHNEEYRKKIKGYMLRHKVKPGITGLAQIKGWRGETDTLNKMERRVECDLDYIRDWSLWLDVKIIATTILKGFVGKSAY